MYIYSRRACAKVALREFAPGWLLIRTICQKWKQLHRGRRLNLWSRGDYFLMICSRSRYFPEAQGLRKPAAYLSNLGLSYLCFLKCPLCYNTGSPECGEACSPRHENKYVMWLGPHVLNRNIRLVFCFLSWKDNIINTCNIEVPAAIESKLCRTVTSWKYSACDCFRHENNIWSLSDLHLNSNLKTDLNSWHTRVNLKISFCLMT